MSDVQIVALRSAYREHRDTRSDGRATAAQRGYGARWQRTRARILRPGPPCGIDGCTEPATDVHHIDGRGPLGPRGYDPTNLLPLCHAHHSQITAASRPKRARPSQKHPGLL